MPRIVQPPLPFAPHHCLVTNREDGDFIDFEADANVNEPFPRVVLQRGVVEEAARECCGMVSGEDVAEIRRQMAELSKALDEVLDEVQLTRDFEAKFGKELEGSARVVINGEPVAEKAFEIEPASPAGEEGV